MSTDTISRRDFLIGAGAVSAGVFLLNQEILADADAAPAPAGPPVGIGVIGLGLQGRDILTALGNLTTASVVAVCDTYEPYAKRALEAAPKATAHSDYKKLLEQQGVEAVIVATPSHLHRQIVLDALAAGKHVYCESPIASTVDEAKEIAKAGLAAKQVFQAGLQLRSSPLRKHVFSFVKSGVPGAIGQGRAQWHKKQSWRRMAPTPEREAELNWRLKKETSSGLLGEVGVHQIDVLNWYVNQLPVAVTAFGGIRKWTDGRDVADTVQAVFEYPEQLNVVFDATLVNSYEGAYECLYGSEAAIMLKGERGWMIKEVDSAMLGWEPYAHKEKVGDETGIALVANATKIIAQGKEPGKEDVDSKKDALYYAMEEFAAAVRGGAKPEAGPQAGYAAAVCAIKANEALLNGAKVTFQKEWFDLA